MPSNSKDLLHLEAETSSLDSKLLFCNRDDRLQSQTLKPDLSDKKPNISSIPKSQLFSKIQDFLPVFSEDTKKLELDAKDNPLKYDIEALTGEESECIEMDLMLGVTELRTQEAVSAAESAIASYQQSVIDLATSDNDTESEDSSDDEEDIHDYTSKSHEDGASSVEKESNAKKNDSSKKAQKRKRQLEDRANIVELS